MSPSAQKILEEALQLPPDELDWLVESLLIKEKNESETEIEAAWDVEIKRRLDEIDSGAVEMIPGEQVRAEMIACLSPQSKLKQRI
jgi:putative addiction module component (TIGR02574 family)